MVVKTELDAIADLIRDHRIVILADFLPPDFGAVGQYMLLRAQALAERGHDVNLFGLTSGKASVQKSKAGRGRLIVTRLSSRAVPRDTMFARLVWTIDADLRLLLCAFRSLRKAELVIFTGSPPLLVHLLAPLKFISKGRLVYRITDFHPECSIAVLKRPSAGFRLLQALTNFWRRRIDAFEVLGLDQWQRLRELGIEDKRISLVRDVSPVDFSEEQLAEPLPPALGGKCVLLYSGNFGLAHEWETVAQGYRLHYHSGSGRVHLWLNATGKGAELLADYLKGAGLPFFHSAPVPLERLAGVILSAHGHLITLKDAFVGFVMPSKVYACLASRRPLIFVGSANSDVDFLASHQKSSAYWRVPCGDAEGFARVLEQLADGVGPMERYPV